MKLLTMKKGGILKHQMEPPNFWITSPHFPLFAYRSLIKLSLFAVAMDYAREIPSSMRKPTTVCLCRLPTYGDATGKATKQGMSLRFSIFTLTEFATNHSLCEWIIEHSVTVSICTRPDE